MKRYTGKDNVFDYENAELGELSQGCYQHDNCRVSLVEILEDTPDFLAGTILFREDTISDVNEFILEADDVAELKRVGCDTYLNDRASDWANNGEEDYILEMCRWGLHDITDYAYDGEEPCNVIAQGCFYGYTPIERIKDEHGDVLTFQNSKAALEWIKEQEEGTYYLQHNEAGRPLYVVVEA